MKYIILKGIIFNANFLHFVQFLDCGGKKFKCFKRMGVVGKVIEIEFVPQRYCKEIYCAYSFLLS